MSVKRSIAALALALLGTWPPSSSSVRAADLNTLETYVEELNQKSDLNMADKKAVFRFVFSHLKGSVKVYPTENYYYFKFLNAGAQYTGNIRLETATRDLGKLHFSYSMEFVDVLPDPDMFHSLLDSSDGVDVERLDPLRYRVTFEGKSVTFLLNDLSGVKPPAELLAPAEEFIGPVFDDSGVRFFLIYNTALKQFLFVLDETAPPADALITSSTSDSLTIGRRTLFGYYQDRFRPRKILIGVYRPNSIVNNTFDGPFDQLPDNFIKGEALRDAIIAIDPKMKGKIDRLGNSSDGQTRYLIAPYLEYDQPSELMAYDKCAMRNRSNEQKYYKCFVDISLKASGSRR